MLRRETIFHSIFSIMPNFWILVWRLDGGATTIIARAVLGMARLNRLVRRRLCRNWESSQRYESYFWDTLESGRWGLAESSPVSLGEALQLAKPNCGQLLQRSSC